MKFFNFKKKKKETPGQMLFKYNEADILEILSEYLAEKNGFDSFNTKSIFIGTPGKDLRLVSVVDNEGTNLNDINLKELDEKIDFNGDHSFLEKNIQSDFNLPENIQQEFSLEKYVQTETVIEKEPKKNSIFEKTLESHLGDPSFDELLTRIKRKRGLK